MICCCYQRKPIDIYEMDEKSVLEYVTLLWSLMLLVLHAIFFPYGLVTHLGLFFMILTCFAGIAALQSPKRTNCYRILTSVFAILTAIIFVGALLLSVIAASRTTGAFSWPILMPIIISLFEILAAILMAIKHLTKYIQRKQLLKEIPRSGNTLVMKSFGSPTNRKEKPPSSPDPVPEGQIPSTSST